MKKYTIEIDNSLFLNFEQSSFLFQNNIEIKSKFYWAKRKNGIMLTNVVTNYNAPAIDEIKQFIPERITINNVVFYLTCVYEKNEVGYCSDDDYYVVKYSENTLINSLYELIVFLLHNGLIK